MTLNQKWWFWGHLTIYWLIWLKFSQVKVGKTTEKSCISRHDYYMFTAWLLPEFHFYWVSRCIPYRSEILRARFHWVSGLCALLQTLAAWNSLGGATPSVILSIDNLEVSVVCDRLRASLIRIWSLLSSRLNLELNSSTVKWIISAGSHSGNARGVILVCSSDMTKFLPWCLFNRWSKKPHTRQHRLDTPMADRHPCC